MCLRWYIKARQQKPQSLLSALNLMDENGAESYDALPFGSIASGAKLLPLGIRPGGPRCPMMTPREAGEAEALGGL